MSDARNAVIVTGIPGVGKTIAKKLQEAGYGDLEAVAAASPGNLKEIGLSETKASEIIDAAKKANAHEFIINLDKGYNTQIGERGVKLSGGEKQRIAIARAILRNPRILILDEATSSLDAESEVEVQKALNNLMTNRTVLVVAHRLSTIVRADRIYVLEGGRIVEKGTHESLFRTNGVYRQLFDLQMQNGILAEAASE